jgi:GrpB-like predicted nucleotidyltransferase (UPF0157 family)
MILLEDYNLNWPLLFENEKKQMEQVITHGCVTIKHIGSTAVPQLIAKPIIDILLGVHSLEEADRYMIDQMKSLGYQYVPEYEDELPFRRYFKKRSQSGCYNVHLVVINTPFWNDLILFRDILRQDANLAVQYGDLKTKLAATHVDVESYAIAKTDFITAVLSQAKNKIK